MTSHLKEFKGNHSKQVIENKIQCTDGEAKGPSILDLCKVILTISEIQDRGLRPNNTKKEEVSASPTWC